MRGKYLLSALILASVISCITWFSGPEEFDYLDGTEFVLCGKNLEITHPPGYPLFVFMLRTFSGILPCSHLDYTCFRLCTSLIAGAGFLACIAVLISFGISTVGALAGSLFFFTLGPVMSQLNVVEIHGFSILLVMIALKYRHSRSGPYFFSLSLFGGHPLSFLLISLAITSRFRQRWVLLASIPFSLCLFVPLRSMYYALCHYSHPTNISKVWNYFTLYSSRLTVPEVRGFEALWKSIGFLPLAVLFILILLSKRFPWKLAVAALAGFLFISSYSISDIDSLLWIPLLPLVIWASKGFDTLLKRGLPSTIISVVLVSVSLFIGVTNGWRKDDVASSMISRDILRGADLEAVFISVGFTTFHSAYLLDVEDRRPDLIPMDIYKCFFRILPPSDLPASISGRPVFATRGWNQHALSPDGLLFSAGSDSVNWEDFDIFRFSGHVHDTYTSDKIAELWARRAIQTTDRHQRNIFEMNALNMIKSQITENRIRTIFEIY